MSRTAQGRRGLCCGDNTQQHEQLFRTEAVRYALMLYTSLPLLIRKKYHSIITPLCYSVSDTLANTSIITPLQGE